MNWIKYFDLFPEKFEFHFNNSGRFGRMKTFRGGIVSIVMIIGLIFYSILKFNNFINNRKASIIQETQYSISSNTTKINNKNLQMAITLWNMSNFEMIPIVLNTTLITEITIDVTKNNKGYRSLPLGNLVNCDKNHTNTDLYSEFNSMYSFYKMSSIICLNMNLSTDFEIGGDLYFGKSTFLNIDFKFDLCSITADCKNDSIMNNMKFRYAIIFDDYFFNVSESNGYTKFVNTYYFDFIYGHSENLLLNMIKNDLTSNDDIFIDNKKKDTFYNFELNDISYLDSHDSPNQNMHLTQISIQLPLKFNKYIRSYEKLETYLANANAIITIIIFFGRYFIRIIDFGHKELHLMRNLYYIYPKELNYKLLKRDITIDKKEEKYKVLSNYEIENINKKIIYESIKNYNISEQNLDFPFEKFKIIEDYLKGKEFKKETCSWITFYLFCKKKKNMKSSIKHFIYGKAMLNEELDIINVLKKLIDFERLLFILFSEKELDLINGINHRKIYDVMKIKDIKKGLRYNYREKISKETIEKFISAFNYSLRNSTKLSKKITNLIKKEI